jgi:hypothetical protein
MLTLVAEKQHPDGVGFWLGLGFGRSENSQRESAEGRGEQGEGKNSVFLLPSA